MAIKSIDENKKEEKEVRVFRPERAKLSAEESLKRVEEFAGKRMEEFIAAVRKGKD